MNSIPILFVLFVVTLVSGQNALVIDNFSDGVGSAIVVVPSNPTFPITETNSTSGSTSNIIGGDRNIIIQVDEGNVAAIASAAVNSGRFLASSASSTTGNVEIQWDGDESTTLNPSGLGSVDFTDSDGDAFRITIESDISSNVEINVYSGSASDVCSITFTAQSTSDEFVLLFSSFSNGCSFDDVGAVQMIIDFEESADIQISSITIVDTGSDNGDDDDSSSSNNDDDNNDDDSSAFAIFPSIILGIACLFF